MFGQPPSPQSRRRRPRSARGLPRRGLDAGARDPPWWPAAFATVSTPAAEDRIFGQPPSPPSRRRWPRSVAASLAAVSTPAAERSRMWPASLATVSTPAAEIRRGGPPPSPRSRRRRPRSAAVARLPRHGFDAGGRDTPRWPASLAAPAVSTPAAEIRRRTAALAACLFSLAKFLDQILSILR